MKVDKRQIKIVILGKSYTVEVDGGKEEYFLSIVEELNDNLRSFQSEYPNHESQDSLVMVALQYAVELSEAKRKGRDFESVQAGLTELETILDKVL